MRLILASDSGSFGGKYTRALPVGPNGFHASQSEEAQPVPKVVTWGRMLLSNSYPENCGLVNSWRLKSCLLLPHFEGILGCLLCNICQHQIIALKNCFSLFNRKYLQIFAYVPLCQWLQKNRYSGMLSFPSFRIWNHLLHYYFSGWTGSGEYLEKFSGLY